MTFHMAGKYNGDPESLPKQEHPENYVPFKEPSAKKLSLVVNVGALAIFVIFGIPYFLLGRYYISPYIYIGLLMSFVVLIPHELLHAICFKEDVYMYHYLSHGMMFVVGPEAMTKRRFIFMSLLPNIVFGFIPYVIFLLHPQFAVLGFFGLICLTQGFGDYMNVFNAATQMPKNALTYLSGMNSYWYIPNE